MAFPPSVTVKDYTWGGSAGYLNPKRGKQPARFKTIIQIVPPSRQSSVTSTATSRGLRQEHRDLGVLRETPCAIRRATSVASGTFLSRSSMSHSANSASAWLNGSVAIAAPSRTAASPFFLLPPPSTQRVPHGIRVLTMKSIQPRDDAARARASGSP